MRIVKDQKFDALTAQNATITTLDVTSSFTPPVSSITPSAKSSIVNFNINTVIPGDGIYVEPVPISSANSAASISYVLHTDQIFGDAEYTRS